MVGLTSKNGGFHSYARLPEGKPSIPGGFSWPNAEQPNLHQLPIICCEYLDWKTDSIPERPKKHVERISKHVIT